MISPQILRRYPYFRGLSESTLTDLAARTEKTLFEEGAVVFRRSNDTEAKKLQRQDRAVAQITQK